MQCQAVKILHGMETIGGARMGLSGLSTDAYLTEYQRKPDCYSHETLEEIIPLDEGYDSITIRAVAREGAAKFGRAPVPELCRDVLEKLICRRCAGGVGLRIARQGFVKPGGVPQCANPQRDRNF